jgi:hypothetical protein
LLTDAKPRQIASSGLNDTQTRWFDYSGTTTQPSTCRALAVGGIALGAACALASWRLVAARVPGLRRVDPLVRVLLAVAIAAMAAAATWLPARRATRQDPVLAGRAKS